MAKITCTVNVQVTNGPKVAVTKTADVEAYDSLDVTIPKGGAETEVQVQPGGAGQVSFLLITADQYADKLAYTVTSGGTDSYMLDGPHLMVGTGGVSLLDTTPPASLFFKNTDTAADAMVHILVGRDATP